MIRGIVEEEIQAMVSKRENIATHHSYQAWDPVPSLSPATTGTWWGRAAQTWGLPTPSDLSGGHGANRAVTTDSWGIIRDWEKLPGLGKIWEEAEALPLGS